ncbi:hypothetical protein MMC30_006376 [Trapelia coarctata]|nr:hypothetical protein [Trapelia coarctata]
MDGATARLVRELYLQDIEEVDGRRKEKESECGRSDAEVAFNLLKNEIRQLASSEIGRQIAARIARAGDLDEEAVERMLNEEASAVEDQHLAGTFGEDQNIHPENPKDTDSKQPDGGVSDAFARLNTGEEVCSFNQLADEPKVSEPASASAASSSPSSDLFTEDILEEICVGCKDDHLVYDILQAPCGHFFCRWCFHQLAEAASRDESLYPPSCCQQIILLSSSKYLLENELIKVLESKAEEFGTTNRTYCSDAACSEFIPIRHIRHDVAACLSCSKETCSMCKGPPHIDTECPDDPDEKELEALAKALKWARCPNCKRRIELETGCNHMRCLSDTEFCYRCNRIWKTCLCPQYDEDQINAIIGADDAGHPVVQVAEPPAVLVFERRREICSHRVRFNRIEGRHVCGFCHERTWVFILECPECHVLACAGCRDELHGNGN